MKSQDEMLEFKNERLRELKEMEKMRVNYEEVLKAYIEAKLNRMISEVFGK